MGPQAQSLPHHILPGLTCHLCQSIAVLVTVVALISSVWKAGSRDPPENWGYPALDATI